MEAWVGDVIQALMFLVVAWSAWQGYKSSKKIEEVHEKIDEVHEKIEEVQVSANGLTEQLVKTTGEKNFAAGIQHEKDRMK